MLFEYAGKKKTGADLKEAGLEIKKRIERLR